MNKKLFTLAAALMLGSAFTVNAQNTEAENGTKLDGSTYYFLKAEVDDVEYFLRGLEATDGSKKYTKLNSSAWYDADDDDDVASAMWKVKLAPHNGTDYVELTNKLTGSVLRFKNTGEIATSASDGLTGLTWAGLDDVDDPEDGVVDYDGGGKLTTAGDNKLALKITTYTKGDDARISSEWVVADTESTSEESTVEIEGENWTKVVSVKIPTIEMYLEDANTKVTVDDLNKQYGNGFSFDFVGLKTQPSDNIFGQKLYAYAVTHKVVADNVVPRDDQDPDKWMDSYAAGMYFATSPKPDDVAAGKDEQNWFLTTSFVSVSPVEHLGIPSLEQEDGVGFKLVTVLGKDLKKTNVNTAKKEVSSYNAAFTIAEPAPKNEAGSYTLSVTPRVKEDAGKDGQARQSTQYITLSKVMGENYVTTSETLKDAAKVKLGSGNTLAAKNLLKKDGASVYNILFVSGTDQTTKNPTEYGKYLGVTDALYYDFNGDDDCTDDVDINGTKLLAQGPSFVDPKNAEMQWVITGATDAGQFTFKNREDGSTFTTALRETAKENVYEVTMPDMAIAYVSGGYYYTKGIKEKSMTIELKPATVDKTAGYADYTDEELNQLVKLQFEVGSNVLSKSIYVGVYKGELYPTQDIANAAQWELIKRTGISDTIYSEMSYAYLDKDGKVKADKTFENHEVVTYSIKLYQDGDAYYYTGKDDDLVMKCDKLILAPRFAIKENVDGTIALIPVGDETEYGNLSMETLGIDGNGELVYDESVYALPYEKSYLFFGTEDATPSLAAVSRHASFESVNGGFLGVGAKGDAIVAATKDEAQELTFWLDTTDVEKYTPSFYISQGIKAETKADAAEVRNFLFNAKDSVSYYDEGTASTVINKDYLLNTGETKAIFKAGTLVNKDSLNTIVAGKEVGLNNANGLRNFKFNIVLADADVADEYVIKSVANNNYVANINGKVALVDDLKAALVVKLGAGDATANEAIEAAGVQVIGGQGVVTVQGAAGKVVTVSNILGQTIANQVATSDNVTIAAPAGVVVVAVDGEATKVVVK